MLQADSLYEPTRIEAEFTGGQAPSGLAPTSIGPEKNGVTAKFEGLVNPHLDGLYRSALRLTRHRAAAEDLVQDVMLRAWRSFHTFHEGADIKPWLYRILMNAHFNNRRKLGNEPAVVDVEDVGEFYIYEKALETQTSGEAENPEELVLNQTLDSEVQESLESLPLRYRAAVILADLQGFSYAKIAEILGVPYGTVLSRLSRGRHMLQRKLWDYAQGRRFVL